jgi:tetratricopeptide (TPR) repeat protein
VDVGVAIYPAASHGARDKPDVIAACKKAAEDWVKVIASRLMGSTGIPRGVGPPIIAAMLPDIVRNPESGNGQLQGYFDQAKSSLQRHDLNGALSQFEQAYKAAPDSAALNYNLSWMYQAQERPLTAVKHAENYLRLAPDASDRADVEARIADMREELRTNPRAQYDPNSCREIYNWAQVEKEAAKRDVARRQAILEILIASQRGDCETARKLQQNYKQGNR